MCLWLFDRDVHVVRVYGDPCVAGPQNDFIAVAIEVYGGRIIAILHPCACEMYAADEVIGLAGSVDVAQPTALCFATVIEVVVLHNQVFNFNCSIRICILEFLTV